MNFKKSYNLCEDYVRSNISIVALLLDIFIYEVF